MAGRPNGLEINTPSDGYEKLASDTLTAAIKAIEKAAKQLQSNVAFLHTPLGHALFEILDINPDVAIAEVLDRNGIEIIGNGNGHAD